MNIFQRSPLKTKINRQQKTQSISKPSSILNSSQYFRSMDPFESFLYRDHVTRFQYQVSELKKCKRIKTLPDGDKDGILAHYNDQYILLQNIKQNRNKEIALKCRHYTHKKYKSQVQLTENNKENDDKLYRQIRKEVTSLNREYFRDYLYHQQPLDKTLIEINSRPYVSTLNKAKITELKNKLLKCMELRNHQNILYSRKLLTGQNKIIKTFSQKKEMKQATERQIDEKFEKIWDMMRGEIGTKIKMEGEFNLYRDKIYKYG